MTSILMSELLSPRCVLPRLSATTKRQALQKLSRHAAGRAGLDEDAVEAAVLSHGDLTTFGLGRGVAVPHAAVPGLTKPVGALARLNVPVDFGAADGRPADLVFLVLAPEHDESILLRALSCAARRLRDGEVAERLRHAATAQAAHIILTTDGWRESELQPEYGAAA